MGTIGFMKIFRVVAVFALLCSSSLLSAATIEIGSGSSIVVGLVTDFSTVFNYDVRGAGLFNVIPPAESIGVFDAVGGTDPSYSGALAFGNSVLYLQSNADFGQLLVSFSSPIFNGAELTLTGTASALTPSPTAAALNSVILNSPLTLNFTYIGSSAIEQTGLTLVQWQLTSITDSEQPTGVPEPATVAMMGAGMVVMAVVARRRTGR